MASIQPTRILIIRFSSIGDIVLTSPIIRCLKEQLVGEVQIDYLTKKQYATLVDFNPYINEVITIEERVAEVAPRLRDGRYDYIVDLHHNIRSKQVKRLVKTLHFTLDKRNLAKWLYVQTKRPLLQIGHVVDRSFDAIAPLAVVSDGKGLDYFFPPDQAMHEAILPARFQGGYFAYAIGGQMKGKILPVEQIISICAGLRLPVVLLGGAEDRQKGEAIKAALGEQVFNACGAFSLHQSARLLAQAEKVVTHDTGLMHIAVALRRPLVSLWLATTPELGFAPWKPQAKSIAIEAVCKKRPTSKLGNRGYKDGCVFRIDTAQVIKAVNAPVDETSTPA